jgi:murein DD-endopeptidase MepM/ murein hydrolase activator NlpD
MQAAPKNRTHCYYYEPAQLHVGNRVHDGMEPSIRGRGIHELGPTELSTTRLEEQHDGMDTSTPDETALVVWVELQHRRDRSSKRKRRQSRLALELTNPYHDLPVGVSLSLSASAQPELINAGGRLQTGLLCRACPETDATPNLPASMGSEVRFVTIACSVPPRSVTRICSCVPDADALPGFVYIAAAEKPHPSPSVWQGLRMLFPLAGGPGRWLCTQGFGGAGHHRGLTMHHSVDIECDEGTTVVAVADGRVLVVCDSGHLGAGHVDLLPEANLLKLELDGGHVATYLHLLHGSAVVCAGQDVKAGQPLASSGNVGFTTGPHLHFQINTGSKDEDASVMFGFRDDLHGATVPVAGYWYSSTGCHLQESPPQAIEQLRTLLASFGEGDGRLDEQGRRQLRAAVVNSFLQVKVDTTRLEEPRSTVVGFSGAATADLAEEEDDEEALRAFPSEHTCLVCNVLAFESLLREGERSRFLLRGVIPPCYLACTCNFDRDCETGEIFSYEIAPTEHQERILEELTQFEEVRFCLDPQWRNDWLSYFNERFHLVQAFEIYKGDEFLRNQSGTKPCAKGETVYGPLFTLRRSTMASFEGDTASEIGRGRVSGGCVVVFRYEAKDKEPFGMWFGWLRCKDCFFVVDMQNGEIAHSLIDSIQQLEWAHAPRCEVFWAPFKSMFSCRCS